MVKNLIPGPNLDRLSQNWAPKVLFVGLTSTSCQTLSPAVIVFNFKEKVRSKLIKLANNFVLDLI